MAEPYNAPYSGQQVDEAVGLAHAHGNMTALNKLTESGGVPLYGGASLATRAALDAETSRASEAEASLGESVSAATEMVQAYTNTALADYLTEQETYKAIAERLEGLLKDKGTVATRTDLPTTAPNFDSYLIANEGEPVLDDNDNPVLDGGGNPMYKGLRVYAENPGGTLIWHTLNFSFDLSAYETTAGATEKASAAQAAAKAYTDTMAAGKLGVGATAVNSTALGGTEAEGYALKTDLNTWQPLAFTPASGYTATNIGIAYNLALRQISVDCQGFAMPDNFAIGVTIGTFVWPAGLKPTTIRRLVVDIDVTGGRVPADIDLDSGGAMRVYPILPSSYTGATTLKSGLLYGNAIILVDSFGDQDEADD
jgi:hypothetical protein